MPAADCRLRTAVAFHRHFCIAQDRYETKESLTIRKRGDESTVDNCAHILPGRGAYYIPKPVGVCSATPKTGGKTIGSPRFPWQLTIPYGNLAGRMRYFFLQLAISV